MLSSSTKHNSKYEIFIHVKFTLYNTSNLAVLNKLHKPLRRLNGTPTNQHQHGSELLMPDTPQFATPGAYGSLWVACEPSCHSRIIRLDNPTPECRAKVSSFKARGSTVGLNSQMTPTERVDESHRMPSTLWFFLCFSLSLFFLGF
ncbi:hypothetical protein J3F84DRAFT_89787 [Trichoderma pleuroticola]